MSKAVINRTAATAKILTVADSGEFFGVTFTKKDGSVRDMVCRLARTMSKGKTGEGMKYDPIERGLIPVYDTAKKAYRMVNVNTLTGLRIGGVQYRVA